MPIVFMGSTVISPIFDRLMGCTIFDRWWAARFLTVGGLTLPIFTPRLSPRCSFSRRYINGKEGNRTVYQLVSSAASIA
jgi:hypothetical protein